MTASPTLGRGGRPTRRSTRTRMRIGVGFAAVPFAAFTLFALGEAAALEPGWWSHLLQVAAVALLTIIAWQRPRIGGPLLVVVGLLLTAMLLILGEEITWAGLVVVGVFSAPLIVAGVFFSLAGYGPRPAP